MLLEGRSGRLRAWVIATSVAALVFVVRLFVVPLSLGGQSTSILATAHRAIATLGQFVWRVVVPWPQTAFPAVRLVGPDGFEQGQDIGFVIGCLVLVALTALGLAGLRSSKARGYFADAMWFVLPLTPTLNIHDTDAVSLVSDRMLYLPMIGVAALVARAIGASAREDQSATTNESEVDTGPVWAIVLAVGLAIACTVLTLRHVPHFRAERTLWQHEVDTNPRNLSALQALAGLALSEQEHAEALRLCRDGYTEAFEQKVSRRGIFFALCQARALLAVTPDTDQATLKEIRDVYDRLFATGKLEASSNALSFQLGVRPDQQDLLFADPMMLLLPRARAHARTGAPASARQQLDVILKAFPNLREARGLRDAIQASQVGDTRDP